MFTVYSASKTHSLLYKLTSIIQNKPLNSIFSKDVFLVSNQGSEHWLSQQLAQQLNVWANYQFLQSNAFFKHISKQINVQLNNDAFEKEGMLWMIETLLRSLNHETYAPLMRYLQGDNIEIKRYQLAEKIAQLFESYQLLRPELLDAWQQGYHQTHNAAEGWQRFLWLQMSQMNNDTSLVNLWQTVINQLTNTPIEELKYRLPQRVFIFGFKTFSPEQLHFLQALSKHCDIHFFLQSSQLTFGALNASEKHSLINSLGQQECDFQQLLLQNISFTLENSPSKPILQKNNLQQLQNDILHFSTERQNLKQDNSISIHACHSKMREIEVLKDNLLDSLESDSNLSVGEIIVVSPNIEDYTPFIKSVFDDIPYDIVGCNSTLNNTLLDAFVDFLDLIESRFEWQTVLNLLEHPAVFPNFDLSITDLEHIKFWLNNTYVRWGKSAEHKQKFKLPPLNENTWKTSLDRLLMGYAVASEHEFIDNTLPYSELEGSSAQALGGLNDFIQLLFTADETLSGAKCFQEWAKILYYYADAIFIENDDSQALYHLLADFGEKLSPLNQQPIALSVIIHYLKNTLATQKSSQGLFRGKLTFCSLDNARGIPFKVIAILGMNEGEFPTVERTPTFNLLASSPKLGDPSARTNDRQQFLDLLLAAESQLIISYKGQSQNKNDALPPSVVVSELLDVLEQDYQLKNIIIKHPLQPFSRQYFDTLNPQLFSYSQSNAAIALTLSQEKKGLESWWKKSINPKINNSLELEELRKFYRHPQRYFMHRQLDVYFQSPINTAEASEPFIIEGLELYDINQHWVEALLKKETFSCAKLQAQGRWLSGTLGEIEFAKQHVKIMAFVEKIRELNLGKPLENLAVDANINEMNVTGKLYNCYEKGSLFYRYAPLKAKDIMLTLLHHCLINQHNTQNTYLISQNKKDDAKYNLLTFTPEHGKVETLQKLIEMYIKGLKSPDALFLDIALDYAKQTHKTRAQNTPTELALYKLKLALEQPYEMALQRLYAQNENLEALLAKDFLHFCDDFFQPLWTSLTRG